MSRQHDNYDADPPRWAEALLRLWLAPRDRDSIAGDLLEEYREVILPARGRFRARLWYLRQVLSLVDAVTLGLVLGATFGLFNLIATQLFPVSGTDDDPPVSVLLFYAPIFIVWVLAGFAAYRRSGRLWHAIKVGMTAACVTFLVFDILNLARVNLFLEKIQHRSDWQNLVSRYHASGFSSLRTYANYEYVTGTPIHVLVASLIGATLGFIGGVLGSVSRRRAA
jgi:hypothetical protein